jgi:hypothetical protein
MASAEVASSLRHWLDQLSQFAAVSPAAGGCALKGCGAMKKSGRAEAIADRGCRAPDQIQIDCSPILFASIVFLRFGLGISDLLEPSCA